MPAEQKSLPEVLATCGSCCSPTPQETVDPLKGLGRFIGLRHRRRAWSVLGVVLLTWSLLRVLQAETDGQLVGQPELGAVPGRARRVGALVALAIRAIAAKASGASTAKGTSQ